MQRIVHLIVCALVFGAGVANAQGQGIRLEPSSGLAIGETVEPWRPSSSSLAASRDWWLRTAIRT
jgi:hypothetical protein